MKTQLDHWRVLDSVVTFGGVSQAGMYLHRTQSAISYSLKQLEEQTGVELLTLVGRKLQLTPAGHQLLQEARQILKQMSRLEQQAKLLAQGIGSTLIVAIEQITPITPVLKALKRIQVRYPHINIQWHAVILSETDTAFNELNADVMITAHVPANHTGLPWCDINLVAVAASQHPLSYERNISLTTLTEHTQAVIRDKGQEKRDVGWLGSPKRWTVDSIELSHQLVKAGLAYAWLPEHLVNEDIQKGTLKHLALEEADQQEVKLYLVLNPHKTHGEVMNALKVELLNIHISPSPHHVNGN